jgi:hypothetical protein
MPADSPFLPPHAVGHPVGALEALLDDGADARPEQPGDRLVALLRVPDDDRAIQLPRLGPGAPRLHDGGQRRPLPVGPVGAERDRARSPDVRRVIGEQPHDVLVEREDDVDAPVSDDLPEPGDEALGIGRRKG